MLPVYPDMYTPEERNLCIEPIIKTLLSTHKSGSTTIIAVQGGQGTGKTTLAAYLVSLLSGSGYKAVSFSIDDFYTGYLHRKNLSALYPDNPYYRIPRGMPGTHDTKLLFSTLSMLKNGENTNIPVFDKSLYKGVGDISSQARQIEGRQDFVLFEGWCAGIEPTTTQEVIDICRYEGIWEDSLLMEPDNIAAVLSYIPDYLPTWKLFDISIMLRPDTPGLHIRWREEQEEGLIKRTGSGMPIGKIGEFVRTYLPFTYLCYNKIKPDILIRIDREHRMYGLFTCQDWC